MKLRRVLMLAFAAAAIAGAISLAMRSSGNSTAGFRSETISRGTIEQKISANGTLNPVVLISVGTQVSGTVRAIHADFNDPVRKGQVLIELDDSLLAAQARQSAANVLSARAALDLAIANEARQRDLVAKRFVTERDLDQAIEQHRAAEAALAVAKAQADRDRVNLGYTVIRSPIDGIVIDRVVDVGQTVAASFQTPELLKIAGDLRKMQIDTSFAEADIGSVRAGQDAAFTVDAYADRHFAGRVAQIRLNPKTEQNVVTYNVVIAVDNPDGLLLPGMTATVSLTTAERSNVLKVPNAALRYRPKSARDDKQRAPGQRSGERAEPSSNRDRPQSGPSSTIWLLVDGKPSAVSVATGITDGRHTEVSGDGVAEGSEVIVGDPGSEPGRPASSSRFRFF